jgi:SAM-dependent methyltransferase
VSEAAGYDRFLTEPLFAPWAELLRQRIPLPTGTTVVDVACGSGTLARPLARAIGRHGRVLAVDSRPGLLASAAAKPIAPGAAPITYLECSVTALRIPDECADVVVVCQLELPAPPDPLGALREMCRVLRPGGAVAVATWAAEQPLGLFGPMAEALAECGVPEPFPRAFDPAAYTSARPALAGLLEAAGFTGITVDTQSLDARWPSPADVLATMGGSPYAAGVTALPAAVRERVEARLAHRLNLPADGPVCIRTSAHLARARKPATAPDRPRPDRPS